MPALVRPFDPRTVGEVVQFAVDFAPNLNNGETIVSASVTCALVTGTDANPSGRISGSATINGSVVAQLVTFASGVTSGNIYLLTFSAVTSLGETLIGYSNVTVNASGS